MTVRFKFEACEAIFISVEVNLNHRKSFPLCRFFQNEPSVRLVDSVPRYLSNKQTQIQERFVKKNKQGVEIRKLKGKKQRNGKSYLDQTQYSKTNFFLGEKKKTDQQIYRKIKQKVQNNNLINTFQHQ
ncbi:unnamed protein product [Paramecium pentaurelia]|uniref:Uncharacterized protein n=1 Tax=Paramecium pentaurelia TaxID=43138 RepID=A0A8S1VZC6_9CILI|nr:unnamed protein product [Paramecium pentaurelia]